VQIINYVQAFPLQFLMRFLFYQDDEIPG